MFNPAWLGAGTGSVGRNNFWTECSLMEKQMFIGQRFQKGQTCNAGMWSKVDVTLRCCKDPGWLNQKVRGVGENGAGWLAGSILKGLEKPC